MQNIKSFLFLFVTACFLCLVFTEKAVAQEDKVSNTVLTTVPGTDVKMNIPDVYVYNAEQEAFIYPGASSGIIIKKLAGTSFEGLALAFTDQTFSHQQMKVISTEELITNAGKQARLYTCTMQVASTENNESIDYTRLVFVAGDETNSVLVTANYPQITDKLLSEPLRTALLSITF